jgi:hypothetical protein
MLCLTPRLRDNLYPGPQFTSSGTRASAVEDSLSREYYLFTINFSSCKISWRKRFLLLRENYVLRQGLLLPPLTGVHRSRNRLALAAPLRAALS